MNELEIVRELFEEPSSPPSARVVVQARRLATGSGRRRVRLRWAVSGIGVATAGTVAVAVAVSGTTPGPRGGRVEPQSARTVLLNAALRADDEPATSGAYWHLKTLTRWSERVQIGRYLITATTAEESWQASASSGTSVSRTRYMGAHPATAADRAAWRGVGSPHTFVTVDGKRTTTSPEALDVRRGTPEQIDAGDGPATQVGLDRLRTLPSDPVRLRAWLLSLPGRPFLPRAVVVPRKSRPAPEPSRSGPISSSPEPPPRAITRDDAGPTPRTVIDQWLFEQGSDLILTAPITPKVRAAAFRMLAALPEAKLLGTVRDADGRSGTAVGIDSIDPMGRPDHVSQHRLIIDGATGHALADETMTLARTDTYPGMPAGAIVGTNTVLQAGWTNRAP